MVFMLTGLLSTQVRIKVTSHNYRFAFMWYTHLTVLLYKINYAMP